MSAYLAYIKNSDHLPKALDFINSIAIDSGNDKDTIYSYPKNDYQLLLYKSQALNKYLTIDFDSFNNTMKVTVEDGTCLNLETPLTEKLDTALVKGEFQSLLNSNKEWNFKQSYTFRNYASGFFNENIRIHKWDMYSESNELMGVKILINYEKLVDIQEFNSTMIDIVMSEDNLISYNELQEDNDVAQKLLNIVL
ncbi:uncharacterized protein HGUI_03725 [Hanseniaspora guilliermondii]|uniref:Uncharacterized protein n=1 Tax=Hanseniaspora guilliermondii TaxID=56406 RepID=A0A1L0B6R2_9ASCO|nr:uncharacterized protein HGUI_03725 [Hanseniaspora guilliermondii]